jgi:hypothetical protein
MAADDAIFRNSNDKGNGQIVHGAIDSNGAFDKQLRR